MTGRLGLGLTVVMIVGGALAGRQAWAQENSIERGEKIFRRYCGSCHGKKGKGNGPLARYLETKPANLTEIEERNDGYFPRSEIFDLIDGTGGIEVHGGSAMPVWGPVFRAETGNEEQALGMIEDVVAYVTSIQKK